MGLVAFIVLGLLVGIAMRMLMPHDDPGGVVMPAVIGLVGGLMGGVLAGVLVGMDPLAQFFNLIAWGGAVVGAFVLLTVYLLITAQSA